MKKTNKFYLIAGMLLALVLCTSNAMAVLVNPGDSAQVPATTAFERPELAGPVINDDIAGFFVLSEGFPFAFGHYYQNRVVRSDVTDTVIIEPRLRDPYNVTGGQGLIDGLSINGYAGWNVDVNYRTDGEGDRGPTFVERSANGDMLTFTFGFPIVINNLLGQVTEESFFINILTDAPSFTTNGRATLFGRNIDYPGVSFEDSIGGIAIPSVNNVPVPSSMLLLLTGITGLGLVRVKKTAIQD